MLRGKVVCLHTVNRFVLALVLLLFGCQPFRDKTNSPVVPNNTPYEWAATVSGLTKPVAIANAGDGSNRLFVVEQAGRIQLVKNGSLASVPFLDISGRVKAGGEQGLLGLVFHPNFSTNGYFYVNYTALNGDSVTARFHVSLQPDVADASSEQVLLQISDPYPNHNGGSLAFGPDGYLYLGLGDGGSEGDPEGRAQSLSSYWGKLLRVDVDSGSPYAIPPGNPFAGGGGLPEIWAFGLRNPWRISFDSLTGDLYIADVGQDNWEEIDWLPANSSGGANFGWSLREGTHFYKGDDSSNFVEPVVEYSHGMGNCAVVGGYVYRGATLAALQGVYFYADFCSGAVWGISQADAWKTELAFGSGLSINTFGVDEQGEIYVGAMDGNIYQLRAKEE